MDVTAETLEAVVMSATGDLVSTPDPALVEALRMLMHHVPNGSQISAQILAARIHAPDPLTALLALSMTDRLMRKCGPDFHAEIGKFRFLNEMIKLVSPKYLADVTSPEVKNRVLKLLNDWSIDFPQEAKFKVAHDMLMNQGILPEVFPPDGICPPKRAKYPVYEDVVKTKLLQKLLQSSRPEDVQHANRLIKAMVKEEEKRNKANCRHEKELSTALASASLLSDMLQNAHSASKEEIQLIHELYFVVAKMRILLDSMASHTDDSEYLGEILRANDILNEIHAKYEAFIEQKLSEKPECSSTGTVNRESLLDFAGENAGRASNAAKSEPKRVASNAMDELGDIFSTERESHIAAPLQPVNLISNDDVDLLGGTTKAEGWNELDSLGEQLLKQSLPENAKRVDSFNGKSKKIPMNALTSPKHEASLEATPVFDLDFFMKPADDKTIGLEATGPIPVATVGPMASNDDMMVDIREKPGLPTNSHNILDLSTPFNNEPNLNGNVKVTPLTDTKEPAEMQSNSKVGSQVEVRSLQDINVTLENLRPSNVPPLTAFEENGLTVVMHFCKDRPQPDVNVVVVSTTSRNGLPIEDYNLKCVVPMGCKIRVQTASGTSLPAFNPFLPPPALTQVMLIARPPGSPPIHLKFGMTYIVNDKIYSEVGEVKQLPLDEIE